jgi:hypothetical protein
MTARRFTKILLQAAAKNLTQPKRSPRHVTCGPEHRSCPLPNRSIGGKRIYCTRKGRRCERTEATTVDAHASSLLGGSPSATLGPVGVLMYNTIV